MEAGDGHGRIRFIRIAAVGAREPVAPADHPAAVQHADVALVQQPERREITVMVCRDGFETARLVLALHDDARNAAGDDRPQEP
ncbi:hypothetical protein D3C72_2253080 [compost metagenome]